MSSEILLIALLGVTGIAVVFLGGILPSTQGVLWVASGLILLLGIFRRPWGQLPHHWTHLSLILLLATLASALQQIPLGLGLLEGLAPWTADTIAGVLPNVNAWPVSIEPSITRREMAKTLGYLCFYLACRQLVLRPSRRTLVRKTLVRGLPVVAAVAVVHWWLGFESIFGLYQPTEKTITAASAPFVNPNHFGALLVLGLPLLLARWRLHRRTERLVPLLLCNVALLLSGSYSAIAVGVAGQAAIFLVSHNLGPPEIPGQRWPAVAAIAVAGLVLLTVEFPTFTELVADGQYAFASKARTWRDGFELILRSPWTGVGRGAFPLAITTVTPTMTDTLVTWVENFPLQVGVDWGLPLGLVFFALMTMGLRHQWRNIDRSDLHEIAISTGLGGLLIQNLADYSIEMPGVALPAMMLLATLPGSRIRLPHQPRWMLVSIAVLAVGMGSLTFSDEDLRDQVASYGSKATPLAEFIEEAQHQAQAHPGYWRLHAAVGQRLGQENHRDAMAWINRAMYLYPQHPVPHELAAQVLLRSGRISQGLLEYRLAFARAHDLEPSINRLEGFVPDLRKVAAVIPPRFDLALARWLKKRGELGLSEERFASILETDPNQVDALMFFTRKALQEGKPEQAIERVLRIRQSNDSPSARQLHTRALIATGALAKAEQLIDLGLGGQREAWPMERSLIWKWAKTKRLDRARFRIHRLKRILTGDSPIRAELARLEAQLDLFAAKEVSQ